MYHIFLNTNIALKGNGEPYFELPESTASRCRSSYQLSLAVSARFRTQSTATLSGQGPSQFWEI